jgi:hypothetical protein
MNRFACHIAAVLCIAATSLTAHAELQLSCPVKWADLNDLTGDPDKLVFGVKVRDFKSEYFDAMQRKNEECMAMPSYPKGQINLGRLLATDMLNRRDWLLSQRDANLRSTAASSRVAQAVNSAKQQGVEIPEGSSQITLHKFNGAPFPEHDWECGNARGGNPIGWINEASIKQLAVFTDYCVARGAINEDTAKAVKADLDALMRFYAAIPAFAKRVDAVAARGDAVNATMLAELDTARKQLLPIQHVNVVQNDIRQEYHPQWQAAIEKLDKLRAQITRKACDANYANAKLPPEWRSAYYLFDFNSPTEFLGLVCGATASGAQIRYLSGGMFSKEGFEVKSKVRAVQVFVEAQRIPGGDPKVPLLVAASANIGGKSYTVTQQNFRSLVVELTAALQNR